jgi:hypothetical protein
MQKTPTKRQKTPNKTGFLLKKIEELHMII